MDLKEKAILKLKQRGITEKSMAFLVWKLQKKYNPSLTKKECLKAINHVLNKREVLHTVLTGIAIDEATEKHLLDIDIQNIIARDESLYGIDEILALSIVNVYGSIALTNFGYLDKLKPGIIGKIDRQSHEKKCNTFLDDIVSAIVAAGCAKIAHQKKNF